MSLDKKRYIARMLAIVIAVSGMAVIAGWFMKIPFLTSLHSSLPPMEVDTAVAFILSGISLYYIIRAIEGEFDKAQVILSVTSLVIVLLIITLFFSAILKIHNGIDTLWNNNGQDTSNTFTLGEMSFPVMFNFILMGIAGIIVLLKPRHCPSKLKRIGIIITVIGIIAITGYGIDAPLLYYYIEGINAAMACLSAVLFVLLGIGLLCL